MKIALIVLTLCTCIRISNLQILVWESKDNRIDNKEYITDPDRISDLYYNSLSEKKASRKEVLVNPETTPIVKCTYFLGFGIKQLEYWYSTTERFGRKSCSMISFY